MRGAYTVALSLALSLCIAETAEATFDIMRISEVMAQAGGDPRIQFIEFEMAAPGQNLVGGHELVFYDAHGNVTGTFEIPSNVSNALLGDNILFGTQAFADAAAVQPDFVIPAGLLAPFSGRVCFENIDCVAYGGFTGDNGAFGAPAERFGVTGSLSLTLRGDAPDSPRDNSVDYSLQAPSPRNNSREEGGVTVEDPECFFTDDFDDGDMDGLPDNWDAPVPTAGMTLENCGIPASGIDIGQVEVQDSKLIITASETDQVDLGDTLGLIGMKNSVVLDGDFSENNYRVRFNVRATPWIEDIAFFLRAHYLFDTGTNLFDPVGFTGAGANFEVRLPDGNQDEADIFADGRGVCIFTEVNPDLGVDQVFMNPFLGDASFLPETLYTAVADVDGSDQGGPLTVRVKIFLADQEEPDGFMATWGWTLGIGAPVGDEDHGVVLAALGDTARPGDVDLPQVEISEFSICEIPRNQKTVTFLQCQRQVDGTIFLTWSNPSDAEDQEIIIRVNGALEDSLPGTDTEYLIVGPPEGDLIASVTNYSGVPVECAVCTNDPPVPVIDGPDQVPFDGSPVSIQLDSSASTDPEGSTDLLRFWEVVASPPGSSPFFDDPGAVLVNLTVDAEGTYVVRLTLSDSGCPGDDIPQVAELEHEITVGITAPSFVRGDADSDGEINLTDGVVILNFLFLGGPAPDCMDAADVDDDGGADPTITDAIRVFGWLFRGELRPEPPSPSAGSYLQEDCGPDPTATDAMDCAAPAEKCS